MIFATANAATGLHRVSAAGGTPEVLTRPDRAQGEADHLWPELLPGGRAVLFTITALTGGLDAAQVAVLDLQTGARTVLVRGGSHAQYVPSGHLVYAAAGTLRAIAFDLARLETRGTPVPIIGQVVTTAMQGEWTRWWRAMARSRTCRALVQSERSAPWCGSAARGRKPRSRHRPAPTSILGSPPTGPASRSIARIRS